ncbi:MAG: GNAT family N-acetyltransferase, partial [Nitrososphaerota archaeon]|nr:GNAT family N-acetyltransferase [Nitrososphaerota archaeon]
MEYWVIESDGQVNGYILWSEKGGFREQAVLELEQIAVQKQVRGQGMGRELILRSLEEVEKRLHERGARLKLVEVTTGA